MKKTLRISFGGKSYDVVAEIIGEESTVTPLPGAAVSAAASAAPPPTAPRATSTAAGSGDLPSPLAGKIVSIAAGVGTPVKAGQAVITLEAMKMNTVVSSNQDGTVAAVHVAAGDSVEEGQVLMTIR